MFYLKYRPQKIEEIDNLEISQKLKILLKGEDIPHALLFAGPKGTGKTSAARIFAKAVNCLNNLFAKRSQNIEPCNRCKNCIAVTSGTSADVIEMDAASARKIDDIRNLISEVKYAPLHNLFKIYIIDEVHMLTTESFNALLKTLEEPPKKTIFILATTEAERLPKTIISRCIRFNFAKAKISEIVRMLKRIQMHEKIKIGASELALIAKYSDHSFRDAAKIFEEVVIQKVTSIEKIKNIIGLERENDQILKALVKADLKKTLALIKDYDKSGASFKTLIEFLLDELHFELLAAAGLESEEGRKYNFTLAQITRLIRLLTEAYNTLKISPIESLPLEIAVADYFSDFSKKI